MTARHALAATVGALFVGTILAANYATATYGMQPVFFFGLTATAGTYFAGISFILRDAVQDTAGKRAAVALILVGAALSYFVAPALAVASACAFLLAELADFAVYTPLRSRGYIRAAVASNVVGSVVDTVVFLAVAGFPVWASLPGQLAGKLGVTLLVVVVVASLRYRKR